MLSGTHVYTMDPKGRVVIPLAAREVLGDPLVVTRCPGSAVLVVSRGQWRALVKRHGGNLLFRGYYLSAALACRADPHTGRILIPHLLREFADLRPGQEVAVCGIGSAVLLLPRVRYEAERFVSIGKLREDLGELPPLDTRDPERECENLRAQVARLERQAQSLRRRQAAREGAAP